MTLFQWVIYFCRVQSRNWHAKTSSWHAWTSIKPINFARKSVFRERKLLPRTNRSNATPTGSPKTSKGRRSNTSCPPPKRLLNQKKKLRFRLRSKSLRSEFQYQSILNLNLKKEAFGAVFLDPMINHDCLPDMNKVVKHWSNNKRGTWKIIKKAHSRANGL